MNGLDSSVGTRASMEERSLSGASTLVIVLVLAASYLFNGMDRQVFPALLTPINKDLHFTLAEGGLLGNCFAFNIAIFGILSGWFMKKIGRRATMISGLMAYSFFTFLTPFANSFQSLLIYRSLTGAGEALHICALFSCVGAYFGKNRGAVMGIVNSSFGIGAFLGPFFGTMFFNMMGSWRAPFYIFGVAGVVAATIVAIVVPKSFTEADDREGVSSTVYGGGGPKNIVNSNMIVLAVVYGTIGITFMSYAALYATYLHSQLNYSIGDAGATLGMFGIGTLGGVFGGRLGDKLKTPGIYAGIALLGLTGYLLFHGPQSQLAQSILSLLFGLLVSGYLVPRCLSLMQRNVPAKDVGFAVSIAMPFFYLPGVIAGYLFGRLVEVFGWGYASILMTTLPPVVALVLMLAYRPGKSREH